MKYILITLAIAASAALTSNNASASDQYVCNKLAVYQTMVSQGLPMQNCVQAKMDGSVYGNSKACVAIMTKAFKIIALKTQECLNSSANHNHSALSDAPGITIHKPIHKYTQPAYRGSDLCCMGAPGTWNGQFFHHYHFYDQ